MRTHAGKNLSVWVMAILLLLIMVPGCGSGNRNADHPDIDPARPPIRVPDENFAREVMRLFTIGVVQLNPDGAGVYRP